MRAIQKIRTLPMALRYVIAGPIAFLISILVLACSGFPEKGPDLLSAERVAAFAALFVAGFCFPPLSRWIHSAALLGLAVALYCFSRPIEDMSYRWDFLPQFRVLIGGGSVAVALHALIDLIHWTARGLTRALQRPAAPPGSSDDSGKLQRDSCGRSASPAASLVVRPP